MTTDFSPPEAEEEPLVSVIIPSYNHGRFVGEAVRSVLEQSYRHVQLIVIDDGSTDNSVAEIESALHDADSREAALPVDPVLVRHPKKRSIAIALNEGLDLCRGEYFSYLCADDLWGSSKLELLVPALQREGSRVAMAYGDCAVIDRDGKQIDVFGRRVPFHGGSLLEDLLSIRFVPPTPSVLFRTDALRSIGGFSERVKVEDHNVWLRLSLRYEATFVPSVVGAYRVHDANWSSQRPEDLVDSYRSNLLEVFEIRSDLRLRQRSLLANVDAVEAGLRYELAQMREARSCAARCLRRAPFSGTAWRVLVGSAVPGGIHKRIRGFRRRNLT